MCVARGTCKSIRGDLINALPPCRAAPCRAARQQIYNSHTNFTSYFEPNIIGYVLPYVPSYFLSHIPVYERVYKGSRYIPEMHILSNATKYLPTLLPHWWPGNQI
ncbi:hypothetical protein B5X24_HaOG203641 [Helicoverpa armigera]|uniref:Uncharacterized protein n=1 Tax=Helicoverpa armigera TaxID=29058 RepID=A0A2W1BUB9_HELAM|nr:hypothetical protein B5X24_HaOG203641 [Helicoverpa armigera]